MCFHQNYTCTCSCVSHPSCPRADYVMVPATISMRGFRRCVYVAVPAQEFDETSSREGCGRMNCTCVCRSGDDGYYAKQYALSSSTASYGCRWVE